MTVKLALLNIKKRWPDYVVLLTGLVISVSIFYMFQTLSTNVNFLQEIIPTVAIVGIVFKLGAVILGAITIVYVLYANSFLLSMRKKEYGMYLMFGAKKRKIRQMMAVETLAIGSVSLVIGTLLGIIFSYVMSNLLIKQLHMDSNTYQAINPSAFLSTLIFFSSIFAVTAVFNSRKFTKTTLLNLLHEDSTSESYRSNKFKISFLTLLALLLTITGYWFLWHLDTTQLLGLVVAIVTIIPGTFLFFSALFPFTINLFKNSRNFGQKKLQIFTLSQLSFKATSLGRVFAMVTILLALSLGAVTVGFAFNNFKEAATTAFAYDLVSHNPNQEITAKLSQLSVTKKQTYHVKQINNTVYYLIDELIAQPLRIKTSNNNDSTMFVTYKDYADFNVGDVYSYETDTSVDSQNVISAFYELNDSYAEASFKIDTYHIIADADFEVLDAPVSIIEAINSPDYDNDREIYKEINNLEMSRAKTDTNRSKYLTYTMITGMLSGFVFMGAFLGIAFLAILASCLMFKILSGANQDIPRYQMLHKIGVKRRLMSRSINQEIGIVFLIPGLLGMLHVLFGLKMFTLLLPDPYANLTLPFAIFAGIYFLYYLITTILYKNIVLQKHP